MISNALQAVLVTLFLEVPLVTLCYPKQRLRLFGVALVSNVVTNLLLNIVLPQIRALRGNHVLVGEVLAVALEAFAYAVVARPRDFGKALTVSAVANALSYELGGITTRFMFR